MTTTREDREAELPAAGSRRRGFAIVILVTAAVTAVGGCARGDSLEISDPNGLVRDLELLGEDASTDLEVGGELPQGPTAITETTIRVPFAAGARCTGGDSVEVDVSGGGDQQVALMIKSRDNGGDCDDMGVVRFLDVTFEPGVDIGTIRIVED